MKEVIEGAVIAHSGKISVGSGVGAAAASWTLGEIGIVVGIVCAVLGLIIPQVLSWHFQRAALKLTEKKINEEIRIANINAGIWEKAVTQADPKGSAGE